MKTKRPRRFQQLRLEKGLSRESTNTQSWSVLSRGRLVASITTDLNDVGGRPILQVMTNGPRLLTALANLYSVVKAGHDPRQALAEAGSAIQSARGSSSSGS